MSGNKERETVRPEKIEERSFSIINEELEAMGICLDAENGPVIRRAIHTTADFDYAENLVFTPDAVKTGIRALEAGAVIVTDTTMARAGINKKKAESLGVEVFCFMADPDVTEEQVRNYVRSVIDRLGTNGGLALAFKALTPMVYTSVIDEIYTYSRKLYAGREGQPANPQDL